MTLTILDILYIVLIIFSSIIGTLLILILIKVLKILGPIVEMAEYYEKVKGFLSMYSQVPGILKEVVSEKFFGKNKKDES